jgi:hypothetical protein
VAVDASCGVNPELSSAVPGAAARRRRCDGSSNCGVMEPHAEAMRSECAPRQGTTAYEQGRRAGHVTAARLVNELDGAADDRKLSRPITRYGRLDLLCLDEVGYVQLDACGAELLFQILTEREEKPLSLPPPTYSSPNGIRHPRPRLVAAIVDRITFHAHIIETGSDTYREDHPHPTRNRRRVWSAVTDGSKSSLPARGQISLKTHRRPRAAGSGPLGAWSERCPPLRIGRRRAGQFPGGGRAGRA